MPDLVPLSSSVRSACSLKSSALKKKEFDEEIIIFLESVSFKTLLYSVRHQKLEWCSGCMPYRMALTK
jgi:hypothetical protein